MDNDVRECNLVVDCDEILVNIAPKWCRKILEDREFFRPYFKIEWLEQHENDKEKFDIFVESRNTFYLNQWLKREDIEVPDAVYKKFLSIYDEEDFYYELPLCQMALGLKELSKQPSVKNIYVISRHVKNSNSMEGKINLIKSIFPSEKLIIKILDTGESKGDIIKDINIENGFIFEDEIKNIKDYLKQDNVRNCYLYLPKFGYNIPDGETIDLIIERNIEFKVY